MHAVPCPASSTMVRHETRYGCPAPTLASTSHRWSGAHSGDTRGTRFSWCWRLIATTPRTTFGDYEVFLGGAGRKAGFGPSLDAALLLDATSQRGLRVFAAPSSPMPLPSATPYPRPKVLSKSREGGRRAGLGSGTNLSVGLDQRPATPREPRDSVAVSPRQQAGFQGKDRARRDPGDGGGGVTAPWSRTVLKSRAPRLSERWSGGRSRRREDLCCARPWPAEPLALREHLRHRE